MATTFLVTKNRAVSTLASGIDNAVTSLSVAGGEGANFPSTYPFHITIDDEIMSCTNRSTDALTVVRAQQGTGAAAHDADADVWLNITSKHIEDLNTAVNAIENQVAYGRLDGWTVNKLLKGGGVGSDPTEIDVPAGATIVRKTADETVNNSNTPQNDDHLLLAIGANEIWLLELYLLLLAQSSSDPDFLTGWSYPAGCSIQWGIDQISSSVGNSRGWISSFTSKSTEKLSIETETIASGLNYIRTTGMRITAIVVNGGTAGNVNLQWAQNTATAEDTKVLENSFLRATRLA